MAERVLSGEDLESALASGDLAPSDGPSITSLVKASEKVGHVAISQVGCETWIDLPTAMIDSAELVTTQLCKDHSHPVMQLRFKHSDDPTVVALMALISQAVERPTHLRSAGPARPVGDGPTAMRAQAFDPRTDTISCHSYPCGTCDRSHIMFCSDVPGCPPSWCSEWRRLGWSPAQAGFNEFQRHL